MRAKACIIKNLVLSTINRFCNFLSWIASHNKIQLFISSILVNDPSLGKPTEL